MYKHRSLDKYEAYKPDKSHFVQDIYPAGCQAERFHNPSGYANFGRGKRGFSFGIQKKLYRVSGNGINIDSYHVGKSENS